MRAYKVVWYWRSNYSKRLIYKEHTMVIAPNKKAAIEYIIVGAGLLVLQESPYRPEALRQKRLEKRVYIV